MTKVFISSTSLDLAEYRKAAIDVCLSLDLQPIAMEHFPAMGKGATEGSKIKLDEADLYVGIFAYRYGYIEDGHDISVTEIEFDYAGERGLDRLCFQVHPKYSWPPEHIDFENADKLKAFKEKISKLIRKEFTTVEDFQDKLTQTLAEWKRRSFKYSIVPVKETVFISYRRNIGAFIARSIYDNLLRHGYRVFMDVVSLGAGEFEGVILKEIAACTHFLVILTPGTLERCQNPDDWVRREIEEAIRLQRNIVPILVNDFQFKDEEQYLTGTLAVLPRYSALPLPYQYFDEAMVRLRTQFL